MVLFRLVVMMVRLGSAYLLLNVIILSWIVGQLCQKCLADDQAQELEFLMEYYML